jgi:mRNA interferase MazF
MEGDRDCVVAFISSKTPTTPSPTDILVPQTHEEFTRTGLKKTSVTKLDKIATISRDLIVGELGELGEALRREVNTRLREAYQL